MSLKEIQIEKLEIPFKVSFSHSSATRSLTDSVIVTARSGNHIGYGEACPRSYVTEESFESVLEFFNLKKSSIIASVVDFKTLKEWADIHRDEIDQSPAAWCAIELALLDLFSREVKCSVEEILGLNKLTGEFQYTAVLGDSSIDAFTNLLAQYKAMGFSDFKLKLSGELEHDKKKCDVLVNQVSNVRIRLDANNLWKSPDEVIDYIQALEQNIFALEEPLKANDYDGLTQIAEKLNIKIILDESFIKYQQFEYLINNPSVWIINIRISKMGGLLRSITIAEQAQKFGIGCIVGAQVGETSLLTRAALTLVNSFRDNVLVQEGACGTYLLEHDLFNPVLMFGAGGKIKQEHLNNLGNTGFGLNLVSA